MTRRFLIVLLLAVAVVSLTLFLLIFFYIDPYKANFLVFFSFFVSILFSITSFSAVLFYIIKKIHYRGQIFSSHVYSSLRQGFFVSLFVFGGGIFLRMGVPLTLSVLLLGVLLIFLELLIQSTLS